MTRSSKIAVGWKVLPWQVGTTEDIVLAFIDRLVDPLLSLSLSSTNPPSEDQQKAVAKQMHAVVLLFNYYHRKQKRDMKFVEFAWFCDLVYLLRPSLGSFMNLKMYAQEMMLTNGSEDQLSITEKAMKDACDIALSLDALKDDTSIEGWPISKVAVLLIDSKKENCMLQFGKITEGGWSLVEKDICKHSSERNIGDKRSRNSLKACSYDDELQQLAYDVVNDMTGTQSSDLVVLESHVAYSLSKEKSAAQAYIIQTSHPFAKNDQIPLKFLVESLRGPLAEENYPSWTATEAVNHYHLLPYVGFISSWFTRKDLPSSHCQNSMIASNKSKKEQENERSYVNHKKIEHLPAEIKTTDDDTMVNISEKCENHDDDINLKGSQIQCNNAKLAHENGGVTVTLLDQIETPIPSQLQLIVQQNDPIPEAVQDALSLFNIKKQELHSEICMKGDMLDQYERFSQRIRDGGDVGVARKCVDLILSGNTDCVLNHEMQIQSKSCAIYIPGKSKCEDLELMCIQNNWKLPQYLAELSDGTQFKSSVFIFINKALKLSATGDLASSPIEARESAATEMFNEIYKVYA